MEMNEQQKVHSGLRQAIAAVREQKNAAQREAQIWKGLALSPVKLKISLKRRIADTILKYPQQALGSGVKISSHYMTAIALSMYPSNAFQVLIDDLRLIDPGIAAFFADFGLQYSIVSVGEYSKFKETFSMPSTEPISIVFESWRSDFKNLQISSHVKIEITEDVITQIKQALLRFGELICLEVVEYLSAHNLSIEQLDQIFPYNPTKDR